MKILILEDEIIIALDLQNKLTNLGYNITGIVDTYEEVISSVKSDTPDIVLLDINIKGDKDGIQVANTLKDIYNIPSVFLTAFSNQKTVERIKSSGAFGYVLKPYKENEIVNVLELAYERFLNQKILDDTNKNLENIVNERTEKLKQLNYSLLKEIDSRNYIETQLFQSKENYKNILLNIGSGLIIIDENEKIKNINPSAEEILNLENKNIKKVSIENIFTEIDLWKTGKKHVLKNMNSFHCTTLLNTSNRKTIWVELNIAPNTILGEFKGYIISFIDVTSQKEKESLLKTIEERNRKSFVEGEEKERKRIAMDLHDSLGQKLTAAKLTIHALKNKLSFEDNKELFHSVESIINDSLVELRRISQNLVPTLLKDFGIKVAINKLVQKLNTQSTIHIQFECEDEISDIEESKELVLYRITQEAISNAIKHSQSDEIIVTLASEGGSIILEIKDNGIGIQHNELDNSGAGLFNIKERCESIGGKFNLNTEGGTTITINI